MMIALFAALAVATAPQETLASAEKLGGDLAMGQICEALQRATVNYPYLMEQSEYIHALAAYEGISPSTIEGLFEKGHTDMLAKIEQEYPAASEDPNLPQLIARCDALVAERPEVFAPVANS